MQIDSELSSFQGVILELVCQKLNMMLSETFQLKSDVNFSDYKKLTKIILKEIAQGQVHSVHMTKEDAKKTIEILDTLDCRCEKGYTVSKNAAAGRYTEKNNPFSNSPLS